MKNQNSKNSFLDQASFKAKYILDGRIIQKECQTLPKSVDAYKDIDLNMLSWVSDISLAMMLVVYRVESNFLLEQILEKFPEKIQNLNWRNRLAKGLEAGTSLSHLLANQYGILIDKILDEDPEHAKSFDMTGFPEEKFHMYFNLKTPWILIWFHKNELQLLARLCKLHPPHMQDIDLNNHPQCELSFNGTEYNEQHTLAWGLLLYCPDLLEQIILYHPAHLKTLPLGAVLESPEKGQQIFYLALLKARKTNILAMALEEKKKESCSQKSYIEETKILADLYEHCTSLEQLNDIMQNYTAEELKMLSKQTATCNLACTVLLCSLELEISTWFETCKDVKYTETTWLEEVLPRAVKMMKYWNQMNDPKFKTELQTKKIEVLFWLKKSYLKFCELQKKAINENFKENFLEILLPDVYASSIYIIPPKQLLLEEQINYQILSYTHSLPLAEVQKYYMFILEEKKPAPGRTTQVFQKSASSNNNLNVIANYLTSAL